MSSHVVPVVEDVVGSWSNGALFPWPCPLLVTICSAWGRVREANAVDLLRPTTKKSNLLHLVRPTLVRICRNGALAPKEPSRLAWLCLYIGCNLVATAPNTLEMK